MAFAPLVQPHQLLLEEQFYPTTTQMVFFEYDIKELAQAFIHWRAKNEQSVEMLALYEPFEDALNRLKPLNFHHRRHLFVSTHSQWTAYFNNYALGTLSYEIIPALAANLGCKAVHIDLTSVPLIQSTNQKDEEVLAITITQPTKENTLIQRSVGVRNNAGYWRFWRTGLALSFENQATYQFRKRKRRFTFSMLEQYAAALNIYPFNLEFYTSNQPQGAIFITCDPQPIRK